MRISTLLLSSAALLAGATAGLAADLPSKKAAPVEYVRVCSQFGAGFFYIPGSDTCLKVSGRVRADYYYNQPLVRADNTTTTRARGYLALDSYTATDMGPVRATTRVYVTKDSLAGASTTLDWAYIQFAGVTAGRIATSFFEFAPFGGVSFLGGGANGRGSDYGAINTLAYTYAANGFSATLAMEDGTERRTGLNGLGSASLGYAGHALPDVVGRLEYGGSWGVAALTAAVHQTRYALASDNTDYGFAIQGGLKINLPMLAAGDALFLQAAYADGASSYTGWASGAAKNGAGAALFTASDYEKNAAGNWVSVKTWSLVGGVEHYWVPTISTALFAGYGHYDGADASDWSMFSVGANVKWTPVKNLLLAAETTYQRAVDTPVAVAAGTQKDIWNARLRVQRDF
ncbi:porin [Alsobacter sp. SYSU M60028]|uniref:Porin n=1 Tax=Alsobacter ponti TaxID=2962936 RepID=A0ABT1LA79_9HYPH|nr:porin [Alsobacter ponti]MCP8938397.1 porin [Alsobacter ponti]